jgi:hypothetical protein
MPLLKEQNSREMEAAIKAFKDWRNSREKICRIPERLWKIAAGLSPQFPINTICKNLGLNWGALKKKIDELSLSANANTSTNTNHPVNPQKQPSFVELKLNSQEHPPSLLLNQSTPPHCAIELTRPDGTVMKIFSSCSDEAPLNLDILDVCKTFLGSHGSHGSYGSQQ